MKRLPSVAIVGRANVGKSSLFNALCGEFVSIVDPMPGVTRDRIVREVTLNRRAVELVDTGGVGMESAREIMADVEMQIEIAITQADLVLLVVDAQQGIQPLDNAIAERLRKGEKRVLIVANKCDNERLAQSAHEFYRLGFGEPVQTMAAHRGGLSDLAERIAAILPPAEEPPPVGAEPLKFAIVGRRNVGKSTLINSLAGEPRVVVSELPGTTRDSVDVRIRVGDKDFVAIDTAGVRKRKQISESVDFYSQVRTDKAIERADVVVLMLDATDEISLVDKQLAAQIMASFKPCVIALNKVDVVSKETTEDGYARYLWERLQPLRCAPVVFMSALEGKNVLPLLDMILTIYEEAGVRVPTSALNEVVRDVADRRHPAGKGSRPGNILYATQVAVHPPTVALFVSGRTTIRDDYERYLANQLRSRLPFSHIPIRFVIHRRGHEQKPHEERS